MSDARGVSRAAEPERRAWFHVWFTTYGSWIRADERGFRDHDHRVHSTGYYLRPPPPQEHAGLRRWVRLVMHKESVRLDAGLRARAGRLLVNALHDREVRVLAIAASAEHVHLLARFPMERVRRLVGDASGRARTR